MEINSALHSKQIFDRLESYKFWRRSVSIIFIISYLFYLGWRLTIFSEFSPILSAIYFLAETIGFILTLTIVAALWKYNHREAKLTPKGLNVDVFITTYKEPIEVIRRTVLAARDIEYPHQTFILDDGRRGEVCNLANELGINYVTRPNNLYAKAGNLNNGLKYSKADFIMVFDADHIALPHALDVMLGFFDDDKVAMVQAPQDYYNTDGFQYIQNKKIKKVWNEQSFFFNIFQPCQDSSGSASCVGTGVVYVRKSIDDIGGFPIQTVTEDIHTSLKMNKIGYKTVYLNEAISYGIAASDLTEYYKTRHRWAHGNLHVLKNEKIFSSSGLTFGQRISYLSRLGIIYLEGWQQLLLFIIPVITLIFGLPPFEISIFNVLIILFFPFFSYLMLQEIGCGFSRFWASELFAMIRWPIHIISTLGLFGRKIAWISSTKNIKSVVNWPFMMPQITVLFVSLLAISIALFRLRDDFGFGPLFLFIKSFILSPSGLPQEGVAAIDVHQVMGEGYTFDLVMIAGAWVLFSVLKVLLFIKKVFNNIKTSNNFFQFEIPLPVLSKNINYGNVVKISEEFIQYKISTNEADSYKKGDVEKLLIYLTSGSLELDIEIIDTKYHKHSGELFLNANILWKSNLDRDTLSNCIYSVNWHRALFNSDKNNYTLTPVEFLLKILSFEFLKSQSLVKWEPILYKSNNSEGNIKLNKCAFISNIQDDKISNLVVFEEFKNNEIIEGFKLYNSKEILKLTILQEEDILEIPRKSLDKSIPRNYKLL